MITLYDTIKPRRLRKTDDGYLVGRARVARSGIQVYLGSEVGRPDKEFVRVYRPPEAVFAKDSMATYAGKPMVEDHPAEDVKATNWKDLAKGQIGSHVARDGDFVDVDFALMDADTIRKVEDGKAELSAGYSASLKWQGGMNDAGEEYDAYIENLRINHIAVVQRARGGAALRIGDARNPEPEESPKPVQTQPGDTSMKIILVDGVAVQVENDTAATIIQKALADRDAKLADADTQVQALKDSHAGALAAKDTELNTVKAKLADAEKNTLTDEQIDARAQARADLMEKAKALHDADYAGKTDAEIRATVVAAKMGDAAIKDKSADYIGAAFDVLAAGAVKMDDGKPDPVRKAMNDSKPPAAPSKTEYGDPLSPTSAQAERNKRLTDSWMKKPAA